MGYRFELRANRSVVPSATWKGPKYAIEMSSATRSGRTGPRLARLGNWETNDQPRTDSLTFPATAKCLA